GALRSVGHHAAEGLDLRREECGEDHVSVVKLLDLRCAHLAGASRKAREELGVLVEVHERGGLSNLLEAVAPGESDVGVSDDPPQEFVSDAGDRLFYRHMNQVLEAELS